MPNSRRFLSRRWLLGLLGGAALVFSVLMLHPYPRQSLFGPTIRGKPWCVWEIHVRKQVHGKDERGWYLWVLKTIRALPGDIPDDELWAELWAAEMLPLWTHLANDGDDAVRRAAIRDLDRRAEENREVVLPILLSHLNDTDPYCRITSAQAVWRVSKDRRAIPAVLSLKGHAEVDLRFAAAMFMHEMPLTEPELFEPLAAACEDPSRDVRYYALGVMNQFGKRGIPFLQRALRDADPPIRELASRHLHEIEAKEISEREK